MALRDAKRERERERKKGEKKGRERKKAEIQQTVLDAQGTRTVSCEEPGGEKSAVMQQAAETGIDSAQRGKKRGEKKRRGIENTFKGIRVAQNTNFRGAICKRILRFPVPDPIRPTRHQSHQPCQRPSRPQHLANCGSSSATARWCHTQMTRSPSP